MSCHIMVIFVILRHQHHSFKSGARRGKETNQLRSSGCIVHTRRSLLGIHGRVIKVPYTYHVSCTYHVHVSCTMHVSCTRITIPQTVNSCQSSTYQSNRQFQSSSSSQVGTNVLQVGKRVTLHQGMIPSQAPTHYSDIQEYPRYFRTHLCTAVLSHGTA